MERSGRHENNVICGRVTDAGESKGPIRNLEVRLSAQAAASGAQKDAEEGKQQKAAAKSDYREHNKVLTDEDGRFRFSHLDESMTYKVEATAFGLPTSGVSDLKVSGGCETNASFTLPLNLKLTTLTCADDE